MKDLLGNEIEAGDFVADVRTTNGYKTIGIVEGGQTKGGGIRVFLIEFEKLKVAKEKCLIKIDFETFQRIKNGLIDTVTIRRDEMIERYGIGSRTTIYWTDFIEKLENRHDTLLQMRTEVYKKQNV